MRETNNEAQLSVLAVKNSLYWAVGHISMWVEKRILCTILTGEDLFVDAIYSVMTYKALRITVFAVLCAFLEARKLIGKPVRT